MLFSDNMIWLMMKILLDIRHQAIFAAIVRSLFYLSSQPFWDICHELRCLLLQSSICLCFSLSHNMLNCFICIQFMTFIIG